MQEKEWSDDMGEISGFGGGYEATCRKMVLAGIAWVDANPNKTPLFHSYEGVFGLMTEDNDDAKELTAVITDSNVTGGDCTGAMHHACIGHVLAYKRLGWDEYQRQLRERDNDEET